MDIETSPKLSAFSQALIGRHCYSEEYNAYGYIVKVDPKENGVAWSLHLSLEFHNQPNLRVIVDPSDVTLSAPVSANCCFPD
jgi:hypothetical protein